MAFCTKCGKQIADTAATCPSCGAAQAATAVTAPAPAASPAVAPAQAVSPAMSATDKRILPAFILCFFLGIFGAHRFYVGKTGSAIAQLLTCGGVGVWALVDLILLACGVFTDAKGNQITLWT